MSILDSDGLPRLCWIAGRGGCARRNGVTVQLDRPPDLGLGDGPVYHIDYSRGIVATIARSPQEAHEEDMSQAEIDAAEAALRREVPSRPAPL